MYVRRVRAGEFIIVNRHLMGELVARGLWNKDVSSNLSDCIKLLFHEPDLFVSRLGIE